MIDEDVRKMEGKYDYPKFPSEKYGRLVNAVEEAREFLCVGRKEVETRQIQKSLSYLSSDFYDKFRSGCCDIQGALMSAEENLKSFLSPEIIEKETEIRIPKAVIQNLREDIKLGYTEGELGNYYEIDESALHTGMKIDRIVKDIFSTDGLIDITMLIKFYQQELSEVISNVTPCGFSHIKEIYEFSKGKDKIRYQIGFLGKLEDLEDRS